MTGLESACVVVEIVFDQNEV